MIVKLYSMPFAFLWFQQSPSMVSRAILRLHVCLGIMAISFCLCFGASQSEASKPVRSTFDGCVLEGVMISRSGYTYRPHHIKKKKAFDPRKYEGMWIQIVGSLLPADRFFPEVSTLRILGKCDLHKHKRMKAGWAKSYAFQASDFFRGRKYKRALQLINKAIAIDKKVYFFFIDRAKIYQVQKSWKLALKDANHALSLSRGKSQRKWCRETLAGIRKAMDPKKKKQATKARP